MLPSPNDIEAFVEVAHSQNISRAAERLGLSQPSVSLAIRRLENNFGVPLFIRSKRGVELTQAGKQLLKKSKQLMQNFEELRTEALASMNEVRGHYVLGCHPSVALYSLHRFLPKILKDNPQLEITLFHDLSRKVNEAVVRFEVDLGLVINPVRHPDLVIHKLCTDKVLLWTNPSQGVANKLLADPGLIQSQSIMKKLETKKFEFSGRLTSGSLEVLTQLCIEGAGCAILPSRVVDALDHKEQLKPVKGSPLFHDELAVVYRVENKNVAAVQSLATSIRDSFR